MKAIEQIRIQQLKVQQRLQENYTNQMISNTQKEGIQHIKAKLGQSLKKKLESKVMLGQYIRSMDRWLISKEYTFL